jgi:DNA invertase Pin-like site-specific DNA recombinase
MSTCPVCSQKISNDENVLQFKRGPKRRVNYPAIVELREKGMSVRKIAAILGCSTYTVFRATHKKV